MELLTLFAPFAPLAIVPLGLSLADVTPATRKLQWPAALLAAASFSLEQGYAAAFLALPWFAFTLFTAWQAIRRWLPRGSQPLEEFALDAASVYLAIGGLWMVISRLGARPLGFTDEIILLTAIHFHYAGFAACVFTAMTGRALGTQSESGLYRRAAWAVTGGTPALAMGITLSRYVELAAAFWLALGAASISALALLAIRIQRVNLPAHLCISAAAAATVLSMSMAAIYAWGEFAGTFWLMIPQMAEIHGVANALGFSFFGPLGWRLAAPRQRFTPSVIPFSRLYGGKWIGPDFFERTGAASGPHTIHGLTGDFSVFLQNAKPEIRAFYERTEQYDLYVTARWAPLFQLGGKLFVWWGRRIGQLGLPLKDEDMESRLFPLSAEADGRQEPRAWVRTQRTTGRVVYAAAYAAHSDGTRTYMNIAFPLPGGNMTSILYLRQQGEAVELTTRWQSCPGGHQGVYFATRRGVMRLPLNETIRVSLQQQHLYASHDMWLWGLRYLRLEYTITKRS